MGRKLGLLPSPLWGGVGGGGHRREAMRIREISRGRAKKPLRHRQLAREMRRAPTDAERRLWWHLRHSLGIEGTHFRRQVQIDRYIVDFACHAKRLIIEVDGGQHGTQAAADDERTKVLQAHGYVVLRYWNNDVLQNIDGVLEDILVTLTRPPTPNPSPQGGGEHTELAPPLSNHTRPEPRLHPRRRTS